MTTLLFLGLSPSSFFRVVLFVCANLMIRCPSSLYSIRWISSHLASSLTQIFSSLFFLLYVIYPSLETEMIWIYVWTSHCCLWGLEDSSTNVQQCFTRGKFCYSTSCRLRASWNISFSVCYTFGLPDAPKIHCMLFQANDAQHSNFLIDHFALT